MSAPAMKDTRIVIECRGREVRVHVCRSCTSEKECPPTCARARANVGGALAFARVRQRRMCTCHRVCLGVRGERGRGTGREQREKERESRSVRARGAQLASVLLDTKMAEKILRSRELVDDGHRHRRWVTGERIRQSRRDISVVIFRYRCFVYDRPPFDGFFFFFSCLPLSLSSGELTPF